jgi:hypothetical protein
VRAVVSWVPASEGGRAKPHEGATYSSVAMWPGQGDVWSVVLTFEPGNHAAAMVRFLVEGAPEERLVPGSVFAIYEGRRKVADIKVEG